MLVNSTNSPLYIRTLNPFSAEIRICYPAYIPLNFTMRVVNWNSELILEVSFEFTGVVAKTYRGTIDKRVALFDVIYDQKVAGIIPYTVAQLIPAIIFVFMIGILLSKEIVHRINVIMKADKIE
ncbi:hypothetical protein ROZALSC1DRAFT_30145 [Rozella allomycis CSF55]|uniref:Uncharacterized protein n=1 Tax=Rozella allomycis (strain CSF55) TaxID=988480 RepID=A0A075B5F6_ROZAC|nr:hypothetical protein O9G_004338 [Rozella allomycis CSF55]RKP18126.1 hypothetical protein ROZALSC1DRAFT_30145 [Rozella allomycis CSF55]|eukprot:EPZ37090.1 hypothetical protein O9G_004338 [Rozella allomycis CSF55]